MVKQLAAKQEKEISSFKGGQFMQSNKCQNQGQATLPETYFQAIA